MIRPFILVAAVLCFCAIPLHAETPIERELQQLGEQYRQAKAAATKPITQGYQASLESLLNRATKAGEQDAILKINEALIGIGVIAAPAATPDQIAAITKAVVGVTYTWQGVGLASTEEIRLEPNGVGTHTHTSFQWKVSGPRAITLTKKDGQKAALGFTDDFRSYNGTDFNGKRRIEGQRKNP